MRMRFKRRADLHVPLQAWNNKVNLTVILYALGKRIRCDLAHTRSIGDVSALPMGMERPRQDNGAIPITWGTGALSGARQIFGPQAM